MYKISKILNSSFVRRELNSRFDCIVVWSHGFVFLDEIISELRLNDNFEILLLHKYSCRSIKKLVKGIYSFDYAPLAHLRTKVKYLKRLKPEAFFIFIKNKKPDIEYYGEEKFRHIESREIRKFKNKIRNLHNPKGNDGKISHDHIIHATDNESQTNSILKLIGFKEGIKLLLKNKQIFSVPYYLPEPNKISIKKINFKNLFCRNVTDRNELSIMGIEESIQFRSINNISLYKEYIEKYRGTMLKQDYCPEKFLALIQDFKYLDDNNSTSYIVAKKIQGIYIIQDGLHRAAIELNNGRESVEVCVYE